MGRAWPRHRHRGRPLNSVVSVFLAMPQDYIMRLIEQIAALLTSIIAKERAGLHSEARAEIEEKTQQTIGMGLGDVRRLSPEAVSQLLSGLGRSTLRKGSDPGRVVIARRRDFRRYRRRQRRAAGLSARFLPPF